jgi:hypothetical protein
MYGIAELAMLITILLVLISYLYFICLIIAVPFRIIWNNTIPGIFGLKTISYSEAVRLLIISYCIFGIPFCQDIKNLTSMLNSDKPPIVDNNK